jgi:hypothetical protein
MKEKVIRLFVELLSTELEGFGEVSSATWETRIVIKAFSDEKSMIAAKEKNPNSI